MSASERLKELEKAQLLEGRYPDFPDGEERVILAALPEFIALVEAAEPFHAHQQWAEARGIKGHPPVCGPREKKALSDALAALEKKLG